jgi:iron(III) transport system ATP-binding protein
VDCSGGPLVPGAEVAVSVRQHGIGISSDPPAASSSVSAVEGTVVRNVFLGATRDYIVEAKDGTQLRVTAAPEISFAPGTQVWLTLPAASCRALTG